MNDFDFDKSFSEDFRKNRTEVPSPEKWQRMEASLRQVKEQKRRKRGLFLLPYLLLAGSAGALAWQWQSNQRAMEGLQGRVSQLEQELETCGRQAAASKAALSDAEVKAPKITNQLVPERTRLELPRFSPPVFNTTHGMAEKTERPIVQPMETVLIEPQKASEVIVVHEAGPNNLPLMATELSDTTASANMAQAPIAKQRTNRSPLPQQVYEPKGATENNSVEIDAATVKPVFVKEPKEPKGFVVGVVGGFHIPYVNIASNANDRNLGVTAQYRIKKGWCIQAGYNFGRLRFKQLFEFNNPSGSLVGPPPPAPGYYVKESVGKYSKSMFRFGVRRYFLLQKRLQPSLSLDWVGIGWHKSKGEYKWVNTDASQPAIKKSYSSDIGLLRLSNYQISGALSYRLHKRIELMAQTGLLVYPKGRSYTNKEISYQLGVLGYF